MPSTTDRPGSRSSFTSNHSTHSSSPPRLSIDKRHQPDRRLSTDSTIRTILPSLPGISNLPGISHSSPLATAGSSRGMPPPTPPKDRLPPPQTPTRKPIQRQKSPLSSEAFCSAASPAPSMPGAFPTTPSPAAAAGPAGGGASGSPVGMPVPTQFNSTAYATNGDSPSSSLSSPATASPASDRIRNNSSKRTSSLRNFLPFKALRRSYDNTSPNNNNNNNKSSPNRTPGRPSSSFAMRPSTPGGESMLSKSTATTGAEPKLKKMRSGGFWRRKSGLGVMFGGGGEGRGEGEEGMSGNGRLSAMGMTGDGDDHGEANGVNGTVREDGEGGGYSRSATPAPGAEGEVLGVKKRKSGTFWRRKSSLNLLGGDGDAGAGSVNGNGNGNGNGVGHERYTNGERNGDVDMMGGVEGQQYNGYNHGQGVAGMAPVRTRSPPPQIPAFIGGGEGLGLEVEDIFKDIR